MQTVQIGGIAQVRLVCRVKLVRAINGMVILSTPVEATP